MKSRGPAFGFLTLALLALGGGLMIVSCSAPERRNTYSSPDEKRPLVDEKYSLSADRKKFDEMRAEVPPERKKENDELALILQLTGEVKKEPSDIRSEFDKVVRKKRELFDKDMSREREQVSKREKKERDLFLKSQTDRRDAFLAGKHDKEERNEFFKDSETRRQDYFANERERRNDFESDMRDKRKNFEDYIREKNNEFNQEYRAYSRKYEDMKKKEREEKAAKQKAEFEKLSSGSATPSGGVYDSVSGTSPGAAAASSVNSDAAALDREIEEARRRAGSALGVGE